MIPSFPNSKKLELSDRSDIEAISHTYAPYSDFNFVSLWSYDTNHLIELSELSGNLVLRFQDYVDLSLFYTFLGNQQVESTIHTLLYYSRTQGIEQKLKMVPHSSIKHILDKNLFQINEDRDNFDYVISAKDFSTMEGSDYHKKRNMVSRFMREYGSEYEVVQLDLKKIETQREIVRLFHLWEKIFGKSEEESAHELAAIYKLFEGLSQFELVTFGIKIKGELVAFLISELIHDRYAIRHFEKPDVRYHGITEFLQKESARYFFEHGCEFINYEQDLGLSGLREAKTLCNPVHYLKKYQVFAL